MAPFPRARFCRLARRPDSTIFPAMRVPSFLVLALALTTLVGRGADDLRALDQLDFRKVVKEGKGKVFPAVVFIKCLREDMQRGEKQSDKGVSPGH